MPYTPDVTDATNPLDSVDANTAAAEFRTLKGWVNSIFKTCIFTFKGALTAIPTHFQLCDGTNGTIDLRDKFIAGAGNTYAVAANGGEATHVLTTAEMPSHAHSINDPGHVHSATTYGWSGSLNPGASAVHTFGGSNGYPYSDTTNSDTTGITINNTGGGTAHNNLPPYYALAFIQYVGP